MLKRVNGPTEDLYSILRKKPLKMGRGKTKKTCIKKTIENQMITKKTKFKR